MSFDRSFLALAAAANGRGIALELNILARPTLGGGHLGASR
ncbi:exported hypothetical protein [Agrobacterium sp. NCPPB 925]|nr:exported hypothetical protein [Agrobacterium sp. NCPPB 925]